MTTMSTNTIHSREYFPQLSGLSDAQIEQLAKQCESIKYQLGNWSTELFASCDCGACAEALERRNERSRAAYEQCLRLRHILADLRFEIAQRHVTSLIEQAQEIEVLLSKLGGSNGETSVVLCSTSVEVGATTPDVPEPVIQARRSLFQRFGRNHRRATITVVEA